MGVLPMRRLGHILSIALITAGILVIADVGITLAYQEPLSSIYSSIKQGEKESQLKTLESEFLTQSDVQAIDRAKQTKDPKVRKKVESANISQLAERLVDESKPGDALGRIEAPGMDGLNMVFVQGTDESSLELGPGHYPETAMPGQGKTVAIAGHRTTYLAPFRHIDSMKQGRQDHPEDALRDLRLQRREDRNRRPLGRRDHPRHRLSSGSS